ncbi:MAG: hypothetical protein AB3X41_12225 [Leptothrix ochracea]|uniref:hypothetical protein n=1 Tax=Leptothrix ochracea TaxID=735331 RepID=UPI0034E2529A
MATHDPKPTGELVLVDYFYETSSAHYDKSRKVKLYVDEDGGVILDEFEDECDQFSGPRTEYSRKWKIKRDDLIAIIKSGANQIK